MSNCSNPTFREGVCIRRTNWCADDMSARCLKHRVECCCKLCISVMDHGANRWRAFLKGLQHLTRLLSNPFSVGMRATARQINAPGADFDEKQDVYCL